MNFVYPEFLFALAAVSVPIIIHLFNFRRYKKVYFSDIRFLKYVEIETKSRNRLKNLLILLSRILAVAFLVMAFARPFIPMGDQGMKTANSVVVHIDNSFSMSADGEAGSLLEEAKAKAIQVGSVHASGGELRLLTNDFDPRHFRSLSFEEFKNEVAAVQPSPQVRTFDEVASRTFGMVGTDASVGLYYISDLQRTTATPRKALPDSTLSVLLIPISAETEHNIYIDSCWFDSPSRLPLQPDELKVRVRNAGTTGLENLSVKLTMNGVQRSVATANVAARSFEDVTLSFTNAESGMQFLEVSVQDYPITYDDRYLLSFNLANSIKLLIVNGSDAAGHAARLFSSEPNFQLTEVASSGFDYSALSTTDLLVCNEVSSFSSGMVQELMKFVSGGGSLLFIPSPKADLSSTNELLLAIGAEPFSGIDSFALKVEGVNLKSHVFKNVFTEWEDRIDLPSAQQHFITQASVNAASERLLTLANGQPLLSAYHKEKGRAYVLTASLRDEWTNFHRHALFVPAFYNIALNSVSNGTSAEVIGRNSFIPVNAKASGPESMRVSAIADELSFIPERVARAEGSGILVHGQVKKDGHYLLRTESGDTIQTISFNYNRTESHMDFLSANEVVQMAEAIGIANIQAVEGSTESIAGQVKEMHDGKQLWRIFLLLALLCLLFETVLIRIL